MRINSLIAMILLVLMINQSSVAQYEESRKDLKSRFRPGMLWFYNGFRPYEAKMLRKYDRLIVDIAYNDWFGDRKSFTSPWNSIGVNAQLMFDVILKPSNTISFGWGIGWSHVNNISDDQLIRDFSQNKTELVPFLPGDTPFQYKFVANYIEVPLELRFRSSGWKHFKFMMGAKFGFQLNAFDQIKEIENGTTIKIREYGFPDRNLFRYGATARMGFRNYSLFGEFFLSNLFRNRESLQVSPFSIGISISLF
jgi:hypothetical protein